MTEDALFDVDEPTAQTKRTVYPEGVDPERTAVVSQDGLYRYELTRCWTPEKWFRRLLTFVMLNPSTADATVDDPTIKRCVGFGRDLGYDGIRVVNLYAFRATKPADLWTVPDPVGPDTGQWLDRAFRVAADGLLAPSDVIAAWGANAKPDRVFEVLAIAAEHGVTVKALHTTKGGAPGHPLYLPATATPQPWVSP